MVYTLERLFVQRMDTTKSALGIVDHALAAGTDTPGKICESQADRQQAAPAMETAGILQRICGSSVANHEAYTPGGA